MVIRELALRMLAPLYEDEHYLFLRKPAGLPIRSADRRRPAGVVEAVRELNLVPEGCGIRECYRLDPFVSGILALAKSPDAARRFSALLEQGGVERTYQAVVRGKVKSPQAADTRAPVPRRAGVRTAASSDAPRLERLAQHAQRALIRCRDSAPNVRTLRAWLAELRLPIVGDPQHDPRRETSWPGRTYLHLERVEMSHPFTGEPLRAYFPAPASFGSAAAGERTVTEALHAALAARLPYLIDSAADSFRLFSGKTDGLSGLIADKFGDVVVLYILQGKFPGPSNELDEVATCYAKALGVATVVTKIIPKDRSQVEPCERQPPEAASVWGRTGVEEVVVEEDLLRYVVRPHDGFLAGLFLDHRENRRRVRELSAGKRVLNTFAYTCSFSVTAAAGGAASTASVDLSVKALEWGKRNFALNGLALDDHLFFCCDVFEYYRRAQRKGQRFDLVILDPPTFARGKKSNRVFQIAKDLKPLVAGALELLDPEGVMLVATNHAELSQRWLLEQINLAAGARRPRVLELPPAPLDFHDDPRAAKSVWVQFP